MQISKTQSRIIAACVLIVFFVAVAIFSSNSGSRFKAREGATDTSLTAAPQASVAGTNDAAALSSFALKRFQRSETRDGQKLWEVEAERGEYSPQTSEASLEAAHLQLYKQGLPQVDLRSDRAKLAIQGATLSRAQISGNVVVTYEDKLKIMGRRAELDQEKKTVQSEDPVTIEAAGLRIVGAKLRADIAAQVVTLSGGVTTNLNPAERKKR